MNPEPRFRIPIRDHEQPWNDEALCAQVDPEIFYPEPGASPRRAKAICASCAVRDECLSYALEYGEPFGVWGGTTAAQRKVMRRRVAA